MSVDGAVITGLDGRYSYSIQSRCFIYEYDSQVTKLLMALRYGGSIDSHSISAGSIMFCWIRIRAVSSGTGNVLAFKPSMTLAGFKLSTKRYLVLDIIRGPIEKAYTELKIMKLFNSRANHAL